jgi:hypothetical protein
MSSSGFDKNNSYTVNERTNSQRQSSISYSKNWEGKPFNLSTSVNQSQNVSNKTVSLNLPKLSFNVSRIYPLKGKNSSGTTKWYQELQFSYSASLDNQINTYDSLLFTGAVWKNMKNGFKHDIPVSLQIRPFRSIPSFNISPMVAYSGVLYSQQIEKRWDPGYFNSDLNKIVPSVIIDTLNGFFYGQSVNPSISAGINPQLFGMYEFKNPDSRIQKIRHIIRPSASFSYIPVLQGLTTDMYKQVQVDTTGKFQEYSIFEGNIYGTPAQSGRSGSVSLSLVNIVEAKVFAKNDTSGKPKNVKIIDNFAINTSYNIFAESFKWAPVTMSYRTTLFENVNLAVNSNFSLYGLDTAGRMINTFFYAQTKKIMRMTGLSATVDFDLGKFFADKNKKKSDVTIQGQSMNTSGNDVISAGTEAESSGLPVNSGPMVDKYGYVNFDVPWSMRVAYNFYYTKSAFTPVINQTLSLVGDVAITKKTRITYTTGYDIAMKQITMTSLGFVRDLHCWEMSLNWIPAGSAKSWQFTIRVKASMLSDLKYDRRKDFRDQY